MSIVPFRKTISMPIIDEIDQLMVDELRSVGEDSAKKAQELARNNLRLGFMLRRLIAGAGGESDEASIIRRFIARSEGAQQ